MTRLIPIVLVLALGACSSSTPERQIVEDAAAALGGEDRILAVETLTLEGTGSAFNLGQDMTMDAVGQVFERDPYRREIDLAGGRMLVMETRTPNFLYFRGSEPQTQTYGIDGDVGYSIGADGSASRASTEVTRDRRAELFHHPIVLVRAALAPDATLANAREEDGERLVDVAPAGGGTYTLAVDAGTGRPTRITSVASNANLGDVVVETRFAGYTEVDGLQLPTELRMRADQYQTGELDLAVQTVDGQTGDLAAPADARAATPPGGQPAVTVTAERVGQGVWLLAGQGHHSALVEFDDHLLLIEAPISEARTLAVIAKVRETVPGKPLTYLVSTHHHFDHTGGLRAAVAEGLTVITHEGNAEYFEEAAARPHTVAPDALQRSPRPLTLEAMGDSRVIEDGTQRMELYHLSGNPHSDTLVMAYFPQDNLIVQADAFSSNFDYNPYAANLLEHIRERKLDVDRIVPLHGPPVTFDEFVALVDAGEAAPRM